MSSETDHWPAAAVYSADEDSDRVSGQVCCECMCGLGGQRVVFELAADDSVGHLRARLARENINATDFDRLAVAGHVFNITDADFKFMCPKEIRKLINANDRVLQITLLKASAKTDDSDSDGNPWASMTAEREPVAAGPPWAGMTAAPLPACTGKGKGNTKGKRNVKGQGRNHMGTEVAELRSEVAELRSEVASLRAEMYRLRPQCRR